jgi:hypothetical protein
MRKTLAPRNKIESEGKVHYSEGFQTWNTIKIKKELFSEFPELREKRSHFTYQLTFCRSYEELTEMIKSLKKEQVMPLLMWIYKESS